MCRRRGGAGAVYTFSVAGLRARGTSMPAFLASPGVPKPAAMTYVSACILPKAVTASALERPLSEGHILHTQS